MFSNIIPSIILSKILFLALPSHDLASSVHLFFCPSLCQHRWHKLKSLVWVIPYQTCGYLSWVVQGIPNIRSLCPHFWILCAKVQFSHFHPWDRQMSVNQLPFEEETWYSYLRCLMTRLFITFHMFDLDLVFKVTRILENFHIWNFWMIGI